MILIKHQILNDQQFRLDKVNQIKYYFLAEIRERELISKNISKFIASLDYFDFFFLSGFSSQTLTIHRTAREGRGPSPIPLYHFHPLTDIETLIRNLVGEMTIAHS